MPLLWRPLATPWLLVLVIAAIGAYQGTPLAPGALGAMGLAGTLLLLAPMLVGYRTVHAFLEGMAEAGLTLAIEQDTYGWLGARIVHARGPTGTWRIMGELHQAGIGFEVTPPGQTRPRRVKGEKHQAGHRWATKALSGQLATAEGQMLPETIEQEIEAAGDEPSSQPAWVVAHPFLFGHALLLAGLALQVTAVGLAPTTAGQPTGLLSQALGWLGLLGLALGGSILSLAVLFTVRRGHRALAWGSWDARGVAVLSAAGIGGGLVAFGGGRLLEEVWIAGPAAASSITGPLVLVASGALAVGLAVLALASQERVGRPVASLAAVAVGAGGVHLLVRVHGYLGAPVLLTAGALLYLLWQPG